MNHILPDLTMKVWVPTGVVGRAPPGDQPLRLRQVGTRDNIEILLALMKRGDVYHYKTLILTGLKFHLLKYLISNMNSIFYWFYFIWKCLVVLFIVRAATSSWATAASTSTPSWRGTPWPPTSLRSVQDLLLSQFSSDFDQIILSGQVN